MSKKDSYNYELWQDRLLDFDQVEPLFVNAIICKCTSRSLFEWGCTCGAFKEEKIKAESDKGRIVKPGS